MRHPASAICIHGHFYQPPREDPATGRIVRQPSASPFHDWNQRITAECYRPLLSAPILGPRGAVVERVNGWEHLAFDVGPTLLRWLHTEAPDVHEGIVAADRASVRRLGHGNAIAQGYHHAILPLCSPEDRVTELRWGIADFTARFGRAPEGLWLPECAVDVPTLCDVADAGLRFVVLAPRQAATPVDRTQAWSIPLPGDRTVAAFFYDGVPAQGVAFDGWLHNGHQMAGRLQARLPKRGLLHYATDGESYGHHHRHGELALAYAIHTLQARGVALTNYGAWLAAHGTAGTAEIVEPSSWSCAHGVRRWCDDCGCGTAPGGGAWRIALRRELNELRDRFDEAWHNRLVGLGIRDPFDLRNRYIHTRLHAEGFDVEDPLEGADPELIRWMEAARFRLMMFTSCGWFFDDPNGLEPTQLRAYAARAAALL